MIVVVAHARGVILPVRARPGARQTVLQGEHDGALRVSVVAAPENGAANAAIRLLLSQVLGCRQQQITLISGATSRQKRFLVEGMALEVLRDRIMMSIGA